MLFFSISLCFFSSKEEFFNSNHLQRMQGPQLPEEHPLVGLRQAAERPRETGGLLLEEAV